MTYLCIRSVFSSGKTWKGRPPTGENNGTGRLDRQCNRNAYHAQPFQWLPSARIMSACVINGALVWWMGPPGENNGIGPGYACMLGQDRAYIEEAAWL